MKMFFRLFVALAFLSPNCAVAVAPAAAMTSRIKDIASLQAGRDNQLIGYGLIVGLQGTGDGFRASPFTEQSMRAMLQNLGISTQGGQSNAKNTRRRHGHRQPAAFRQPRQPHRCQRQLAGRCHLAARRHAGHDLAVGRRRPDLRGRPGLGRRLGLSAPKARPRRVTEGVTTAGRVPSGAIIERELPSRFKDSGQSRAAAAQPGFLDRRPHRRCRQRLRVTLASAARSPRPRMRRRSSSRSRETADLTRLMADIENLVVETDTPAKVVVNERTGTIVIGADVRVSPVAVSYGTLTVQVTETPQIIQPEPFSRGVTAVQPQTDIAAQKTGGKVALLDGPDLKTLVAGLNNIGVKPDGIIAILQGIKSAGALQAELVLQ